METWLIDRGDGKVKNHHRTRFRYDEKSIFRELSENLYPDHLSSMRELGIQNPFDVDATISRIRIDKDRGEIIFSDNGSGMSAKTISDHFLTIGFSSKKRGTYTKERGRKVIGNKGIGRLSWQKLGEEAEVFTETEGEAHIILMKRNSMDAVVRKVPKKGKTGTRWKISGIIDDIDVESVKNYIQEKAGLLLRLNPDFNIYVNGERVKHIPMEGDVVRLMSQKFDSSLVLSTESKKVALSSRGIVIDEMDLHGLGGYIDSDLFRETSDRGRALKNDDFKKIIEEIRSDLLDILIRMAPRGDLFRKYRETMIRIATHLDVKNALKRKRLAMLIPVQVQGRGLIRLEVIRNKMKNEREDNVFVELSPEGGGTNRSERASDIGYTVILAGTNRERTMVQNTIKARRIEEIPMEILSSRGVTTSDEKYGLILENAADILTILSDITLDLGSNTDKKEISASTNTRRPLPEEYIPAEKKSFYPDNNNGPLFDVKVGEQDEAMDINGIKMMLCEMDNGEIIALADHVHRRIFLNTNSSLIGMMKDRPMEDQRVLLLDEICHEMSHILGFGLRVHDEKFFRVKRYLKYQAMKRMFTNEE